MVQFLAKVRDFSLLQSIQIGPGAHPATYVVLTGGGGFEWLEYDDDHSLPASVML